MNAALLLVSSALANGGDVVPAGWGENAPSAVVQAGGCCGSAPAPAPAPCDACGSSGGHAKLLDRLKAKFGHHKAADCGCDPCGAPAYSPPNLHDKLRAHHAKKESCGCPEPCPAPASPGCAAPAAPAGTTPGCAAPLPAGSTPVTPPKDIPKDMKDVPKETKGKSDAEPTKPEPKKNDGGAARPPAVIPTPTTPATPITIPPLPVAPVSGPKLSGSNSPY